MAHFMGPNGASKFLNARADDGSASAAKLFPHEAHANKSIFYTASGHARTLDQVYNVLARKIGGTENATNTNGTTDQSPLAGSDTTAPASSTQGPPSDGIPMPSKMAQALPFSPNDIVWDTPAATSSHSGFSHSSGFVPSQKLSANSIYLLAQMQQHEPVPGSANGKQHYNS
jgi:hypothetical protein